MTDAELNLSRSHADGEADGCPFRPDQETPMHGHALPDQPDRAVVWSFFSGAMGMDLGLESAGWRPSLAVEIQPVFCQTITQNRPDIQVIQSDVTALTGDQLRRQTGHGGMVDLMAGGPPCQPFCTGGKRAALSDPRGNAILEYLRLVSEIRPRLFILENVANLITAAIRHRPISLRPRTSCNLASYPPEQAALFDMPDGTPAPLTDDERSGSVIRFLLRTVIAQLGYQVRFGVLDAADYGAPQRRLRFILIGSRDGLPPEFIKPTHGIPGRPFSTVRDAIGDLAGAPGAGAQYTEQTRSYFDLVPEGGSWRDLPEDVAIQAMGGSFAAAGGKTGFFRRLSWDHPSPAVTGKPNRKGSAMCHPADSRPLSVRECARLQGFPDRWRFAGSTADQYTQIGNAVPVALGRAIGNSLNRPAAAAETRQDVMLHRAVERLRRSACNDQSSANRPSVTTDAGNAQLILE